MFEGLTCKEIRDEQIKTDLQNCYDGSYILEVVHFDGRPIAKYKYNSQEKERAYLHYYQLKKAWFQTASILFYISFQISPN